MTATDDRALTIRASKRYGDCVVLRDAALTLRKGTVHALVGENGAGKSTLMKIAFGLVRADAGEIWLNGPVDIARHDPRQARARGLGMVQQHGSLVPSLTVVENAVLGAEPTRRGLLALDPPAEALSRLGREVGLAIDPRRRAGDLTLGEQQRAEILAVLYQGARILILDEPTAVLAPVEVDGLLATLRTLVAGGASVVMVSHKLDEVRAVADEVTVLRAGAVVERFARGATSAEIARAMIGTTLSAPPPAAAVPADARVVLEVERVTATRRDGGAVRDVSISVRAGEIVGVAGVEGNGQAELVDAIAGLAPVDAGRVRLAGQDITAATVAARHRAGLGHVAADRHARGLVLPATVAENLALGRTAELSPGLLLDRRRLAAFAAEQVAAYDVRPPDGEAVAASLSGGNQQKVVVARELSRPGLRAVVAAQPTRGVDLGAIALIHGRLRAAAAAGVGLLVVSADLDELLALCHRVVVLSRGRIAGEITDLASSDARTRIGALMTSAAA